MPTKPYRIETLAVHAGQISEPSTMAQAVPVYRTAAYSFRDSEHGANLFALQEPGNIYSRLTNPTNAVLESRLAAMDGAIAGVSLASGTAAIYFAVTNILRQGDELVCASNLYGGTYTMFDAILPQQGITARFTPVNDFGAVEQSINDKTRALYVETVGNPSLEVADLELYARLAQKYHVPLIVDSTFTPPTILRPIEYGADIVVHSLSKWIGGHGTGIGGIVLDAGRFDWSDPKFALYSQPDRGYHGLRYGLDLGDQSGAAFSVRLRTVGLRNQGATLSPDAAWLFLQGIESLPLRMERHCQNAAAVAAFLSGHDRVDWVRYPGLDNTENSPIARKYLKRGNTGMVVFGVSGGRDAGRKLVDSIELFDHVANVGDAKSLIIHPASTTHSQLDDSALKTAGVTPEMVRLSIGLEHIDDIIGALNDGLNAI